MVPDIPIAIYDLKKAPITFDYCTFLAISSLLSMKMGYQGFDLVVIADGFRNLTPRERSYSLDDRIWRLNNLINQISVCCKTIRNIQVIRGGDVRIDIDRLTIPTDYFSNPQTKIPYSPLVVKLLSAELGKKPQIFRPSSKALEYTRKKLGDRDLVTMSPRLAAYDSQRNTSIEIWFKVYQDLRTRGLRPVVLPDFDDAISTDLISKYDWEIFTPAAYSLDLRLAVMRLAKRNLVSSGGLAAAVMYSDVPYMLTNFFHPNSPVANESYFVEHCGLELGTNFLWCEANQTINWSADKLDVLLKYFL